MLRKIAAHLSVKLNKGFELTATNITLVLTS